MVKLELKSPQLPKYEMTQRNTYDGNLNRYSQNYY